MVSGQWSVASGQWLRKTLRVWEWPVSGGQWPVVKEDTVCLGVAGIRWSVVSGQWLRKTLRVLNLYRLRRRWVLSALRGFAVGGAEPPVGAPVCPFGQLSEKLQTFCRTHRYRLRAAALHSHSFVKPHKAASEQILLIPGTCLLLTPACRRCVRRRHRCGSSPAKPLLATPHSTLQTPHSIFKLSLRTPPYNIQR